MKDPIHVMLHQIRPRRLLLIFASTITLILAIQVFLIPFRIASSPFSVHDSYEIEEESLPVKNAAYTKTFAFGKFSLLTKSLNVSDASAVGLDKKDKTEEIDDVMEEEEDVDDVFNLGEIEEPDNELLVNETSNIAEMKVAEKENNATFLSTGNQTILHEEVGATKKKKKVIVPTPVYISEMNDILLKNHAAYHAMRPRWYSARDKELLAAKAQIEHAPPVKNVQGLHAPAFRNISKFIRSYELMEKMLKVYVYKEGQKPIFHQPLRRGIYASEGWFMQLMESSKQFKAKDPRKAHLFYIPFSSRLLQFALYVRNSHNRRNLEQFMVDYVNTIAAKYPYWNRTGGSDHFVAACHDWEGVRKVQQHFLWHSKPVKYDLFHMTMHSIWYNRVYNVRTR